MYALIVANGELELPPKWRERLLPTDLLVAADGGSKHCLDLSLKPDVVIGDLDSLDSGTKSKLEADGVRLLIHSTDKDQTDFELALLHAKQAGARQVRVLAGLGRRWDHSLANLLLAADHRFEGLAIEFHQGLQTISVIRDRTTLDASRGKIISLLPLSGDVTGVRTLGMHYPLNGERLEFGSSRGVSNVMLANEAEVSVESGILLCIQSQKEG